MSELVADFQGLNIDISQYEDLSAATKIAEAGVVSPTDGPSTAQLSNGEIDGQHTHAESDPASGDLDKDNDIEGKLFIGGISWQTTEEGLSYHFSKFGTLADVALMKDKYTGQPRGFGFIKFEDPAVLDAVLAQDEHSIDGRTVDVKRAVPKSEAPGPARATRMTELNKIFVGGLAPSVTVAEFKQYFEGFGTVMDAVVMFDRQTQRSRGFGFVTFQDDAVVQNVLMGTHELNGKMVEVKHAEPKESRSRSMPGAGRGAFPGLYGPSMQAGRGGGRLGYTRGGSPTPYSAGNGYGVYGATAAAAAAAYGSAYGAAAAYGNYPAYAAYAGAYGNGYAYARGAGGYDPGSLSPGGPVGYGALTSGLPATGNGYGMGMGELMTSV